MPEIKEVVSTLDTADIVSEQDVPDSLLVVVVMLISDPSVLYTIGQMVMHKRMEKLINQNFNL